MEVTIPKQPEMNDDEKIAFSTEVAFDKLIGSAQHLKLPIAPVGGFEYYPDQDVKEQFRAACLAVVKGLWNPPKE